MKKRKVRFMINSLTGGGAEKVLIDLLHQLDESMYELELLSITGGVHEKEVPSYVKYRSICSGRFAKVKNIACRILYKLPPKIFASLYLRGTCDLEVAYLEGMPTRFVAASKSKRKIAFVHCDISQKNIIAPYYKNKEVCLKEYQSFSKVCFVSKQAKTGFESTVGNLENSIVVHNIVNFDKIRELAKQKTEIQFQTEGIKLVTVGRLTEQKGYERLIRIVGELEKKYNFQLLIVGEGEERPGLEKILAENQIQSVKLVGFHKNPYAIMCQADMFVCSSLFEGYSTVVTEAIALGMPVITTDCAGMDEILEHGNYGVIVPNSEESLYDGLENLLKVKEKMENLKIQAKKRSEQLNNASARREYEMLFGEQD